MQIALLILKGWDIDLKQNEKKALIKFMLIYMISTFFLELGVAVLYFIDQRNIVVRELQDEMIAYISLSRNGNNDIKNNNFKLEVQPSKHYNYPLFKEDKEQYVSVTCASKYQPDSVFIVTANKSIIHQKLYLIVSKIAFIMGIGFLLFLVTAYYLARLSIRPIENSRKVVDSVIEDILHDLNAPMTSISMNCESLLKNLENEKNIKKVQRIESANKTIHFLYNNLQLLLDKPFAIENETIDVAELLKRKIDFLSEIHPEAKFTSSLEHLEFYGDKHSFERVIDNLFSNSLKYAQPSPLIKVRIKHNKLIIEDNGIGIKDCSKIFERHHREDEGIECSGGLGLGLSIVKKICMQMNIQIELQSENKQGTIFTLYLP